MCRLTPHTRSACPWSNHVHRRKILYQAQGFPRLLPQLVNQGWPGRRWAYLCAKGACSRACLHHVSACHTLDLRFFACKSTLSLDQLAEYALHRPCRRCCAAPAAPSRRSACSLTCGQTYCGHKRAAQISNAEGKAEEERDTEPRRLLIRVLARVSAMAYVAEAANPYQVRNGRRRPLRSFLAKGGAGHRPTPARAKSQNTISGPEM